MSESDLRYSRVAASIARLGESAADAHRFKGKRVLLTGDAEVLRTKNGSLALDSALRLNVRMCPNVTVAIPTGLDALDRLVRSTARHVQFDGSVVFDSSPDPSTFDAILSVGFRGHDDPRWVTINSNGWVSRFAGAGRWLSSDCSSDNAIGALFASALGTGEVFKRLIRLDSRRASPIKSLAFSLFTYTETTDVGPSLPDCLPIDALLVGAGAIGNGIVYLLGHLPLHGRLLVIDRDVFRSENLGTCILIGPTDLDGPKADIVAKWLSSRLAQGVVVQSAAVDIERMNGTEGYAGGPSRTVLAALDNIAARYAVQDLWPDLLIDGAIGDFSCQTSRHAWGDDLACVRCMFEEPLGPSAESVQARATGLSTARLANSLDVVRPEDVAHAVPDRKEFLAERLGKQICAIVSEAVARQSSLDELTPGFEPSVPFVACLSACMVVGEFVKAAAEWRTELEGRFQFDSLVGPKNGIQLPQERRKECLCVTRRTNIEAVRTRRYGGRA